MKTYAIVIVALLLIGGAIYAYSTTNNDTAGNGNEAAVVCTMDAKLCPDGSYVGRVGPNCEFAACPTGNGTTTGTSTNSTTSTTTSAAPRSMSLANASGTIDFEGNFQ